MAAPAPTRHHGQWDGSEVVQEHIDVLHRSWKLPPADKVAVRLAPVTEIRPAPQPGERVVFRSHFQCGFGLPASGFFRSFLDFFHIQPHHLTPNTVMTLSSFVVLCEAYLGILPIVELWTELFYVKLGTVVQSVAAQCGGCITVKRTGAKNFFPAPKLVGSVKQWQKTYFYVSNIDPSRISSACRSGCRGRLPSLGTPGGPGLPPSLKALPSHCAVSGS